MGKTNEFGREKDLKERCGGTLRRIPNNLCYINDLGCIALWLSPLFENNPESYHGYAIQDYTTPLFWQTAIVNDNRSLTNVLWAPNISHSFRANARLPLL